MRSTPPVGRRGVLSAAVLTISSVVWLACGGAAEPSTTTGTLDVTAATAGEPLDPDGYTVTVDDGPGLALATSATLQFPELAVGDHRLELTGIAANCALAGDNPRTVAVAEGGVTQARFEVTCATPTGSLQVTTATTGDSPDADGYNVWLDDGNAVPIVSTGTISLTGVNAGNHHVRLTGIAPNCSVTGDNPRTIAVGTGPESLGFEIGCRPPTGSVIVVASTTGLRQDLDGYVVSVGTTADQPLASNASLTVSGIPSGDVSVRLAGLASNCSVNGDNPRTVSVPNGAAVDAPFMVECVADGSGIILFTSDRSGVSRLYRMQDDGSRIVNLTPSQEAYGGDLSLDGTRIVFAGPDGNDPDAFLFVMNADGSGLVRLGVPGGAPRWSPDGRRIVFTAGGTIKLVNADGSAVTPLVEGSDPDWSPDGSKIAFDRVDRSRCVPYLFCPVEIYTMAADGTQVQKAVRADNASDQLRSPTWSPDGRTIAYTRRCCFLGPNDSGVWLVGGGVPRRLDERLTSGRPVWSPDGSAMALAVQTSGGGDLTVIPSSGGTGAVLARSSGSESPQAWR